MPDPLEHAEAQVVRGNELHRQGDAAGAIACYRAALAASPAYARAHFNLGVLLQAQGRADEAIAHYEAAIAADPSHAKAMVNWGNVLKDRGEIERAAALYERAAAADPRDGSPLNNLASLALLYRGDPDAAAALYRRAIEVEGNADGLNNLAAIESERGNEAEARALYERALAAKPSFVDPAYNLALIALARGDFEAGWRGHELRFRTNPPAATLGPSRLPLATAADLVSGARIAIRKEQGVGDQLLFSTVLPELVARGVPAVVEVDDRLAPAFARSLRGLEFTTIPRAQEAFQRCDFQYPVGSLPLAFRNRAADFDRQPRALLRADPARVEATRAALPAGRRIAISWRSFQKSFRKHIEQRKSASLEFFASFPEDAHLVDVQYGDVGAEREAFDHRHPGRRVAIDGLDLFHDLEGLLAALECCDLVVTTSNATAHFAGAIGKRTWLLYPEAKAPFHYWVPRPDGRSLWYPSVEIVTDARWRTWDDVFAAAAARLRTES